MATPYDIITFGNATRDVFLESSAFRLTDSDRKRNVLPEFPLGSKIEIDGILFDTGGGGTNSAVSFSRFGYRTAYVGRIGEFDVRGKEILRLLNEEGVSTRLVSRDPTIRTAYSVILLAPSGERVVLVYRGASAHIREQHIPWSRIQSRWFYITSLGGNIRVLKRLVETAQRQHTKIAFNPGAAELALGRARLAPILKKVDVLLLNVTEANELAGVQASKSEKGFRDLCFSLPGIVVITNGSHGAIVCDNERRYRTVPRSVKVIDTTGAGDAFGSGFVAAYWKKGDMKYALQVATMNAESVVGSIGAKTGLLRKLPLRPPIRLRSESFPN
jgi:ribokinase